VIYSFEFRILNIPLVELAFE